MPSYFLTIIRAYSTRKLLGVYNALPHELFRINSSKNVIIRDHDTQISLGRSSFDVFLGSDGLVHPSPNTGFFERPNGMSLRPNGPILQEIIRCFQGKNVTIYKLPKGLELASRELTCLWEHSDHYSIQTTVPIQLDVFNKKLTQLCMDNGEKMSKDEFLKRYPFDEC